MAKIRVKINKKTGKVDVDAIGFTGSTCEEATKFLRELGSVEKYKRKTDYYLERHDQVMVGNLGGESE